LLYFIFSVLMVALVGAAMVVLGGWLVCGGWSQFFVGLIFPR
jgi:hypothetical protein